MLKLFNSGSEKQTNKQAAFVIIRVYDRILKNPSLRFLCNMIPTRDHIHKLLPFFEPAFYNQADLARDLKGRHFRLLPQHLLVKINFLKAQKSKNGFCS